MPLGGSDAAVVEAATDADAELTLDRALALTRKAAAAIEIGL